MNLIFIGKIAGWTLFSAGMTVYGTFVVKPQWFGYYGFIKSYAVVELQTDSIKKSDKFMCKFEGEEDKEEFECPIFFNDTETNKNTNIRKLKNKTQEIKALEKKDTFVKIKISKKVKDLERKIIDKKIELISGPTSNNSIVANNTKKTIFTTLFATTNNKMMGKSKYFVGKSDKDFVIDNAQKYTYSGSGFEGNATFKIFNFSDEENAPTDGSDYKSLTFKKTTTNDIKKNKHYLLEIEEKKLEEFKPTTLTYTQVGSPDKAITFSSVFMVMYDEKNEQIVNFLI